jgi:hypothetical protein
MTSQSVYMYKTKYIMTSHDVIWHHKVCYRSTIVLGLDLDALNSGRSSSADSAARRRCSVKARSDSASRRLKHISCDITWYHMTQNSDAMPVEKKNFVRFLVCWDAVLREASAGRGNSWAAWALVATSLGGRLTWHLCKTNIGDGIWYHMTSCDVYI